MFGLSLSISELSRKRLRKSIPAPVAVTFGSTTILFNDTTRRFGGAA